MLVLAILISLYTSSINCERNAVPLSDSNSRGIPCHGIMFCTKSSATVREVWSEVANTSGHFVKSTIIIIIIIKLKSRLSVRSFLDAWISAVDARIDVKLAQNEAPVFWDYEVYF